MLAPGARSIPAATPAVAPSRRRFYSRPPPKSVSAAVHDRHGLKIRSSCPPGVAMRTVRWCLALLLVPAALLSIALPASAQTDSTAAAPKTETELPGGYTFLAGSY